MGFSVDLSVARCLAVPLDRTRISESLRPFLFFLTMKKILLLFLCVISFNAIHAEITWTLSGDGTLTISGTNMPDYSYYYGTIPWYSQRYEIKKVEIENGVTNIGDCD